jgi:hypothetical protein
MNIPVSFLISLLAWLAILINGLVIFRFKPLVYWKEIAMVSIFCSSISTIMQYLNLIALITFIPPILAVLSFKLLSGVRWLHTLIMVTNGVTVSGFLEFGTTCLFHHFDIGVTLEILANDYTAESLYFVGIHLFIALTLYQKRLGFASLDSHRTPGLRDKSVMLTLIFLTANSIAGIFIGFKQSSILYLVLFMFVVFIVFVISNYIREFREDPC